MSTLTFELNKMNAEKIMDGKSWFCSIVTYPFYEDILIKKMEIFKECHCLCLYYCET